MPDQFTGTVESGLDTVAWNLAVYYSLRPRLVFDQLATVRATRQSHRGASVTFTKADDLAVNTTPLNEYLDVDAVPLSDSPVTITLTEHGAATVATAKLTYTSFVEFSPTQANRVAWNAARTIDQLAREAMDASANTITPADTTNSRISVADVRKAKATLEDSDVEPWDDGFYRAFVSPFVANDLRAEASSVGNWTDTVKYTDQMVGGIQRGEIGAWEGFRWSTLNTLKYSGTAPNKKTSCFFLGQEGVAKGYSTALGPYPTIVLGEPQDKLKRFPTVGWKWFGKYGIFRPESVIKIDYKDSVRAGA